MRSESLSLAYTEVKGSRNRRCFGASACAYRTEKSVYRDQYTESGNERGRDSDRPIEASADSIEALVHVFKALVHILEALIHGLETPVYGLEALIHLVDQIFEALIDRFETLFHYQAQVPDRFFDTNDPFGQTEVIVRYRGGRLRQQLGKTIFHVQNYGFQLLIGHGANVAAIVTDEKGAVLVPITSDTGRS